MPSPNETLADDLIVPFASASAPPCRDVLARTALPQLTRLLNRWTLVGQHQGDEYSLTPPHEHALAQALGWRLEADGVTPWAARQAARRDRPCAWFTPCHWSVGMEQVTLLPPDGLDLREDESGALLQALAPWAQEDGLTLSMETPQRWLAEATPCGVCPVPAWTGSPTAGWTPGCPGRNRPLPCATCCGCRTRPRCCSTPTP